MKYFCDVHIQSRQDQEKRLFIVIPDDAVNKMDTPNLTKEMLLQSQQYQEFISEFRPKLVMADYTVYKTEEDGLYASSRDEIFIGLIESGNVEKIGRSEIAVDCTRDKLNGAKNRRKSSPFSKVIFAVCLLFVAFGAFGAGKFIGNQGAVIPETEALQKANEDGMLIPEQQDIATDQEQLTVSIDRSGIVCV